MTNGSPAPPGSASVVWSAPGKVILMGEHAAVYGHPVLVAAVGLRTRAEVWRHPSGAAVGGAGSLRLELPDLDLDEEVEWDRAAELWRRARLQARRHLEGRAAFRPLDELVDGVEGTASLYVRVAAVEAVARQGRLESADLERARSILQRLRITSDSPQGAGFGSSAAVATVTVAAIRSALAGGSMPRAGRDVLEEIERSALEVERVQHGRPSGVDTAAVTRGGVLRFQRRDGASRVRDVQPAAGMMAGFRLLHTGPAAESTGAVVDFVAQRLQRDRGATEEILHALARCVETLHRGLEEEQPESVGASLREGQRALEALGVVPPGVVELVRRVEAVGAAAKVSGAGSLRGPGAGALLVYDPQGRMARLLASPDTPDVLDAELGGPGLVPDAPATPGGATAPPPRSTT